jgi:hypothetical protein
MHLCRILSHTKRLCLLEPVKIRLFVSMNVIFRKRELYYSSEVTSHFGNTLDTIGMRRDGSHERRMVNIKSVPCLINTITESY